ncbi:MAG: DUF3794 domain-containing protein [Bacteroidales bacterium]|nr:DUF3794 domain-containing protein [Clostridium sp.]MCM1204397.1 DUF3794 domain-containing protein [Bacteroidales bacterium]
MEFIKREIRNFTWKVKNAMQFTIDDTINIPENLLDMERLILVKGNVVIEETQAQTSRFQVKGTLNYQILYCADKEGNVFDSLNGKVPFVEYINADGTSETDYIEVHASLNDLTVTMLHSRKISLKALIGIDYQVKENETFQAVTDIEAGDNTKVLDERLSMMSLKLQNQQNMQVQEQVEIPANKPNIYQVIWKSMSVTRIQIKPADGYLLVSGNLNVFLVYTAEEEGMPIQYFTMEVPFEQKLEESICSEDMISGSFLSLDQYHITVVPDEKGEDRLIDLAAEFTVEIKLYGNEELQMVKDAYSTDMEINPEWKDFTVQHLLLRNCAKTRVSDTVAMPKQQSVLQICNVEGSVSIDETERSARGIVVEGVVGTQVTYLNKEENGALSSSTFDLPFSYEIEIPGMREDVTYSIVPFLDQITAMLLSDSQIEIKAEVSLEVLAFTNEHARAVLNMEAAPINQERKKSLPGIVGYIVKRDDTLWSIAKAFYTTVDRIKQINELETDAIAPGDKLVILKE